MESLHLTSTMSLTYRYGRFTVSRQRGGHRPVESDVSPHQAMAIALGMDDHAIELVRTGVRDIAASAERRRDADRARLTAAKRSLRKAKEDARAAAALADSLAPDPPAE